jgi:hypothetical protein
MATSRADGGTRHRPADFSALAEGGFALLLITIGLFWAVGSYAIDVSAGRARETVAELDTAADAMLYSERSRENGTAVLLPRTDAVRLEFATPGQRRSEIC